MKRIYIILINLFWAITYINAQSFDLHLSGSESGNITHSSRNSITFNPGYNYSSSGGVLSANIENRIVETGISYNQIISPQNRSLNTSFFTGAIPGQFNISPVGSANYTIPIYIPEGVSGLKPEIALSYNSNSGPGVAGYGWNVSGLSLISRSPKDCFHDSNAKGIFLTSDDRFSLDGQRLVLISGNYGENGSEYRTSNDIFSKIICYSGTYGPTHFIVKTKSGYTYQYGFDDDSDQKINGFNQIAGWFLNKITDVYGNEINYEYFLDEGTVYLAEITYGPNSLTFYYGSRSDSRTEYILGSKINKNLLLEKIVVKYNSAIIKKYELKYNYSSSSYNKHSLLNEIVEYGLGNARINSTVLGYQNPDEVAFNLAIYNTNTFGISYDSKLVQGDFNGDNKIDFLRLPNEEAGWNGIKVYYGNGNDNFSFGFSQNITIDLETLQDIKAIDINGDGKDEVLYETASNGISTFHYMINANGSFNNPSAILSRPMGANSGYSGKLRRGDRNENDDSIGAFDYNGDGINDIFLSDNNGYFRILSFANSYNMPTTLLFTKHEGYLGYQAINVLSGDFDGDGISDIWNFHEEGLKIILYDGVSRRDDFLSTWPSGKTLFTLGDFNGDGKMDIFVYGAINSQGVKYDFSEWQILLSTGKGFDKKTITAKKANLNADFLRIGDFNGDGSTDLMVTPGESSSWTGMKIYVSKNNGTDFHVHSLSYPTGANEYHIADYNTDGRSDFLFTDKSSPWWDGYRIYRSGTKNKILLEKIADGHNNLTSITYLPLSSTESQYTLGTGAIFPVQDVGGVLPVVSSVISDNGIGGQNTVNYLYEGAKVHRQGKGFICFSKIQITDSGKGLIKEINSGYDEEYFYYKANSIVDKTIGGDLISTTTNIWNRILLDIPSKRVFPYVQTTNNTNHLTGHSNSQTFSYDNYGNLIQSTQNFDNGVSRTISNNFNTYLNTTDWLISRPGSSTETSSKPGEGSVSNCIRYTYSQDGIIKPDFIYYNEGSNLEYYVNNDYNANGNLVKLSRFGSSIGLTEILYNYEPNNVRLSSKTDELGHLSIYTYDTYGRLNYESDYFGNNTTYGYDDMSRITSEVSSLGSANSINYVWSGSNKPTLGISGVINSNNDGSQNIVWYDILGRVIRTEEKSFDGTMILSDKEFDSYGREYRLSNPYFSNQAVSWNRTYSYDNYSRISQITRNTGRNTVLSYSNATITETTAGISSSKTFNSEGLLSSSSDLGGTITYDYFPDGKLKSTTSQGIVTEMQYNDASRNNTQITDPSAGTLNFTYNAIGQVKTQTDARGKLITYNYYSDGRINSIITPEGTTTYYYNGDKQISSVISPNNVSLSYGYDRYGRINNISENISGQSFNSYFSYDAYGKINSRTYPSGLTETFDYNTNGYLSSFLVGGNPIYTITSMNALNQITAATHSSSMFANYGYDSNGYPTFSKSIAYGNYKQDYRYTFNTVTGNLTSRQNYLRNLSETFSYDNLSRLTSVSGPENISMTYYDNGNIKTKSDIGTQDYYYGSNNSGPYALSSVVNSSGLIPQWDQDIKYTSSSKVDTITENNYKASFLYNSEGNRSRMTLSQNGTIALNRWYVGSRYMKETQGNVTKEYTYIGGDAYTAPAIAITQNGTTEIYSLLRDYLGTVTHVVNSSYIVSDEYSFDAWGRRRSANDWSYTLDSNDREFFAGRGYTGHEQLPWFNTINMNGRLYDPLVGRFINVDPYVQAPDETQSFNRYSYCLNNPLKYTDPSGEIAWFYWAGAGLAGGIGNLASNWKNIDGFWDGVATFAIGAGASCGILATGGAGASALAVAGASAAGGAVISANSSLVEQTGSNYSGFNNVNWGQVLNNSAIGAVSGFASGATGFWATKLTTPVNSFNNPLFRSLVVSTVASGAGHIAGGTSSGLLQGEDFKTALANSREGLGKSFAIGATIGVVSTLGVSYANKINPLTGENIRATKGGFAEARALGVAGEQAVGVGSKTRIPSLTGTAKYRIPDQLTSTTLGEVKNVSHLSLTRQLTDFHLYSQQNGLQFILHTRPTTTFSGPLQNLINNGSIIVKPIPFR